MPSAPVQESQAAEAGDLCRQLGQWSKPPGLVVELSRVAKQRATARTVAVELLVDAEGHSHVQGDLPEGVVLRCGVTLTAGEDAQHGTLQPQFVNVLQLRQRVLQVRHGDDTKAQQAGGVRCAIVLGQEIVVGAHAGFVRLVVADVAPEVRAGGLSREEHFGVDTVDILFLQPLLSRAGAVRGLIVLLVGLPDIAPLATI